MIMLPTWLIDAHPLLSTMMIALMGLVAVALVASLRVLLLVDRRRKIIPLAFFAASAWAAWRSESLAYSADIPQVLALLIAFLGINMLLVGMCRTHSK